ncbi:hypothetical protein RGUI_2742 [Rhodovulum sp. P5]|uniref:hypothetical protein n=1 Tax=Rhodovulum sp. P5 TaxID=1564506 RepID=UPI0009C1B533|nr:hypothetical protein [Rhodovulum sp. P5]ARE40883.1 hypothetical protein RGUI_2742 [Rhodovulum sp. P5]
MTVEEFQAALRALYDAHLTRVGDSVATLRAEADEIFATADVLALCATSTDEMMTAVATEQQRMHDAIVAMREAQAAGGARQ